MIERQIKGFLNQKTGIKYSYIKPLPLTFAGMGELARHNDKRIDELEAEILGSLDAVNCPLVHRFTKGMYIREVSIPSGALITSKIHKTSHPFTLSKGKVMISEGVEFTTIEAPFTGITEPGTRRVVYVLEDCIWTTYHAIPSIVGDEWQLDESAKQIVIDNIEKKIIKKRQNKLLNKQQLCLT